MAKNLEDPRIVLRGGSWNYNPWNYRMHQQKRILGVLRGGSWNYNPSLLRAACCFMFDTTNMNFYYGFRCCKPVVHQEQIKRWKDETEGGLFDG